MNPIKNSQVADVFAGYPKNIHSRIMLLRELILETAAETEGVEAVEETLKWGEPSYLTKGGSTIRVAWKDGQPPQTAIYFHCKTKLVDTFRELYRDTFNFEGNRAIVFNEDDEIPVAELKHCISLSLTYKHIRHLPMLGA